MNKLNKSELLLPVGNYQMCLAAIHNGADAIYVGMPGFNARGRSHDHELDELQEIIDTCHLYGVKVHVAFNILIFENELDSAIEKLDQVMKLGPDAFIVQDVGLIKIINDLYPDMEVHGSTQMTVTCHDAIDFYDDLNIKRFVLGRENSLKEIKTIRENTNKELEVFVHGALCVAYSGQCFTSEAIGGRSANRGQCAQSCRFEYDLIVDGKKKQLLDQKYLVSPQDLCGINEIDELMDLGIDSFKVEGRLKSPQFVASVASSYRKKIDGNSKDVNSDIEKMQVNFSRGFFNGWLDGVSHQNLVHAKYGSHQGLLLGTAKVVKNKVIVNTKTKVNAGDGVLFGNNTGAKVYHVSNTLDGVELSFAKDFDLNLVKDGSSVYLNSSDKLEKELSKSFTDKNQFKKIPISLRLQTIIGDKAKLYVSDGINEFCVTSNLVVEKALNASLTKETILKPLKGLSHSAYEVDSFEWQGDKDIFLANKELKNLKKEFISLLNEKRTTPVNHSRLQFNKPNKALNTHSANSKLTILIRKFEQLEAIEQIALTNPNFINFIDKVILDFEFGKDFNASVDKLNELNIKSVIATTRVLKPGEYHNLKQIIRANPYGILVRNPGAIEFLKDYDFKLYGDFGLNISNSVTANYFLSKGLDTICPSYDLNFKELMPMLECVDTKKVEITIHQYMPEFHMEHCVFAAFMSNGNSFKDCGKPCEKHTVELKDMFGNFHQIKADQECRNTMFKSVPQSAVKFLKDWTKLGVNKFRFEALHEDSSELKNKLDVYLKLMSGDLNSDKAYEIIGNVEEFGLSVGQLQNDRSYKARKKE